MPEVVGVPGPSGGKFYSKHALQQANAAQAAVIEAENDAKASQLEREKAIRAEAERKRRSVTPH